MFFYNRKGTHAMNDKKSLRPKARSARRELGAPTLLPRAVADSAPNGERSVTSFASGASGGARLHVYRVEPKTLPPKPQSKTKKHCKKAMRRLPGGQNLRNFTELVRN